MTHLCCLWTLLRTSQQLRHHGSGLRNSSPTEVPWIFSAKHAEMRRLFPQRASLLIYLLARLYFHFIMSGVLRHVWSCLCRACAKTFRISLPSMSPLLLPRRSVSWPPSLALVFWQSWGALETGVGQDMTRFSTGGLGLGCCHPAPGRRTAVAFCDACGESMIFAPKLGF